jgi:hypothetical protein
MAAQYGTVQEDAMMQKTTIDKHEFIPRWDEHEKGFYCAVCGVLKEEHNKFDVRAEPKEPA